MRFKTTGFLLGLFLILSFPLAAQTALKIGFIDMNKAINTSDEGKRSKRFLETQFQQTKKAMDQKKAMIGNMEKELKESLMLSEAAKKAKQEEVNRLKKEFVAEAKKNQNEMRKAESNHTKKIFQDLMSVAKTVARAENFDLILEYNIRQTIIYAKYDFQDITDKVILEYNKLQSIGN